MLALISTIADKLQNDGFSSGDRIAVCCETRIEYYLLTLACWEIGAVIVPVSTRYPQGMLGSALENINCKNLFTSRSLIKKVPLCRSYILEDYVCCGKNETSPLTFGQLDFSIAADASILFTSGSSGEPKGVLHTIGNHYYNALGALQHIPFGVGDRWLVSLPMYHISGFSLIMRSLINGGTLVFPHPGESITDALINENITHLSVVPAQLKWFMQNQMALNALQQCKSILMGGSVFGPALAKDALDQGLPLSTTYGLSESASQVATMSPHQLKENTAASGKILPYRELKMSDDGEILLKGPTLCKGYVFKDRTELPLDAAGYFHTGDIGTLDEEGVLVVTGRKDRMFISGGENIYPEQIEKAILAIDSIEQVYVTPVPDAVMGYRPAAFIKPGPHQPVPDVEAIRASLQTYLERFKIPIMFLPWPQLDSETLKPEDSLFRQLAMKAIAEKDAS